MPIPQTIPPKYTASSEFNFRQNETHSPVNAKEQFRDIANKYAGLSSSRPTSSLAWMDLFGCNIPLLLGGLRNIKSFCEALFETATNTVLMFGTPWLTKKTAQLVADIALNPEEKKDILNYNRFYMTDLENVETLKKAIQRIKEQEIKDQKDQAELYLALGSQKKHKESLAESQKILDFCNRLEPSEELRKKIYKVKRYIMLSKTAIEGGIYGSSGLVNRFFRKFILGEDRFTGTKGYVTDEQSKELGDSEPLSFKQFLGGAASIFLTPVLNASFLNLTKDFKNTKSNPILKFLQKALDFKHGIYPKKLLLFLSSTVPKWIGLFFTSQGRNELQEKLSLFVLTQPLWWLGDRIAKGPIALLKSKKIESKYGVKDLFINKPEKTSSDLVNKVLNIFPEVKERNELLKTLESINNPKLTEEALAMDTKTNYEGIGLHSALMSASILGSQFMTKLRAQNALATQSKAG